MWHKPMCNAYAVRYGTAFHNMIRHCIEPNPTRALTVPRSLGRLSACLPCRRRSQRKSGKQQRFARDIILMWASWQSVLAMAMAMAMVIVMAYGLLLAINMLRCRRAVQVPPGVDKVCLFGLGWPSSCSDTGRNRLPSACEKHGRRLRLDMCSSVDGR